MKELCYVSIEEEPWLVRWSTRRRIRKATPEEIMASRAARAVDNYQGLIIVETKPK